MQDFLHGFKKRNVEPCIRKGETTMKAYLIRKAASVQDWEKAKECIECYSGTKAKREVVIEKTITLTPSEFAAFCDDFLGYWDFIKENRDLMKEKDGIWHCIKVTARGSKISVLVESEGYDFARYTAVIKK